MMPNDAEAPGTLSAMDTKSDQAPSAAESNDSKQGPDTRKSKSLAAICERFLELYPLELPVGTSLDVPLEHLSLTLNLNRRRLYDIINIMECLQMAVKVSKNLYRWYGNRRVPKLLAQLKELTDLGLAVEFDKLMNNMDDSSSCASISAPGTPLQPPCTPQMGPGVSAQSLLLASLAQIHSAQMQTSSSGSKSKRKSCNVPVMNESPEPKDIQAWKLKSLGGTCLKFLALLFKHTTVSLDWAGRLLLCGDDDDKGSSQNSEGSQGSQSSQSSQGSSQGSQEDGEVKDQERHLRNKVRRIYDVANVLCALGLVCKVTPRRLSPSRKVLYAYCGPAFKDFHPPAFLKNEKLIEKPAKPNKPKKVEDDDELSREGLCKRRLDLGAKDVEHSKRVRVIQDQVLSELGASASAMSVLLAVAERELQTKDLPEQKHVPEPPAPSVTSPSLPAPKPEPPSTSAVKQETTTENNTENIAEVNSVSDKLSPSISTSPNGGRSALRALLENKTSPPSKSNFPPSPQLEYPAIRKFVIGSVPTSSSRSVLITPIGRPTSRGSPNPTVVIRAPGVFVRRTGLSIPYKLNGRTLASTATFATHLDVGLKQQGSEQP